MNAGVKKLFEGLKNNGNDPREVGKYVCMTPAQKVSKRGESRGSFDNLPGTYKTNLIFYEDYAKGRVHVNKHFLTDLKRGKKKWKGTRYDPITYDLFPAIESYLDDTVNCSDKHWKYYFPRH